VTLDVGRIRAFWLANGVPMLPELTTPDENQVPEPNNDVVQAPLEFFERIPKLVVGDGRHHHHHHHQ
jgi:hypothetical protein